jgi:hypothetical protein
MREGMSTSDKEIQDLKTQIQSFEAEYATASEKKKGLAAAFDHVQK